MVIGSQDKITLSNVRFLNVSSVNTSTIEMLMPKNAIIREVKVSDNKINLHAKVYMSISMSACGTH